MSTLLSLRGFVVGPANALRVGPLDLDVAGGETLAVLGASGAGKTQLLRGLAALEPSNCATATIAGDALADLEPPARRRRLLYVHQEPVRFEGTVRANLERVTGTSGYDEALDHLLALGLDRALCEQPMATLSGGEAVRVALARALAVARHVLLLDEPTAMLDEAAIEIVIERLRAWKRAGPERAILWAQHPSAATLAAADRFLLVEAGRCRRLDSSDEAAAAVRPGHAGHTERPA